MKNDQSHNPSVESISTKYFYKNERLCFQISLVYSNQQHSLREFDDYEAYRSAHDDLVAAINNNRPIAFN